MEYCKKKILPVQTQMLIGLRNDFKITEFSTAQEASGSDGS